MERLVQRMFTAALFIIKHAKLKSSPPEDWINKFWYSHIMESIKTINYYTHNWVNIKNMLSERDQIQEYALYDSTYMKFKNKKLILTEITC